MSNNIHEEEVLGKAYDARLIKRLLPYARRHLGLVTGGAACMLVAGGVALVLPLIIREIINGPFTSLSLKGSDEAALEALGWLALGYRLEDLGEPGSGLFPFASTLGLGALALLLLLRPTGEPGAEGGPVAWGKVAGYVLALAAYALLLEPLGHLLVTALTLGAIMLGLERIPWPRALAVTAGAVLASWLLFERLLGVPLPHGPLG